ncbi:MAG: tRNA 2-thiouridine(34) synthase MnmA [Syntrophobacterales bacterium]|nr:MAG: tRNA 2-thiouridine(34) synthase MnmA [Syntrophobacterales bacterium]
MKKGVLVGISGGVDSAVAAAILKESGYRVEGLYIQNGFPAGSEREAAAVADRLGFPLYILDAASSFGKDVVAYFAGEYLSGRTPNPCIVCNKKIKLRYLLEEAHARGLDSIATGHYARIEGSVGEDGLRLFKGIDREKDQSYFLFQVGQKELKHLIFPNGDKTKKEIQKMAMGLGLPPRKESQEICFIPDDNYRNFLETYPITLPRPGNIMDREGNVVGKHRGTHTLTIGQRKGLNIASRRPYYVLEINTERDEVIVGRKEDQFVGGLVANNCSWISNKPADGDTLHARTYIRYRHEGVDSEITLLSEGQVRIRFMTPQKAVAPGQAAVFFQGDRLLGGGWIERGLHNA